MVVFICSHCGASIKKSKVEKHYAVQCRCTPHVSCMDCHKEFSGTDYIAHTKCITEDEKYSGKDFVPKPVASKQEEWLNIVRTVRETQDQLSNNLKALLDKIISFENIPRKMPKFMNFLKNNRLKIDSKDLNLLWGLFEKELKQVKKSRVADDAKTAVETETKDSSIDADQESETSPKKKNKKDETENETQILNGNTNNVPDEVASEVTPEVKTKKKKDKNKRKSDAIDDSDMKVPETVESEELAQTKKPKKKKIKLEGTKETVNGNEADQSVEILSEEVTQSPQPEEVTKSSQPEEAVLTKNQKKEKKKKEKYEAELKEIENSQPVGVPPEDEENDQKKSKKKSKKDKHVNGTDNNANGFPEEKTADSILKTKKKRNLDEDPADNVIDRKKKKADVQEADQMEETTAVEQETIPQHKFHWNEIIIEVVKSKSGEIPLKRLRKKVLSEYVNCCGSTESGEKLSAKFSKRLQKVPGITIHKEVVTFV